MDVVTCVFPSAIPLLDYCKSVIDAECGESALYATTDSVLYKELLHTTLIIPPIEENSVVRKFRVDRKDKFPINDIVGRLVNQAIRSNHSYQELNCIALGYRLKSSNSDATMRTNNDTELNFLNTTQALVVTQVWQQLANRIGMFVKLLTILCSHNRKIFLSYAGEEFLRHLLSQPMFILSKNSCYLQVSSLLTKLYQAVLIYCIFSVRFRELQPLNWCTEKVSASEQIAIDCCRMMSCLALVRIFGP